MDMITSWHAGDLIQREEPWLATLSMQDADKHCYNCFTPIHQRIRQVDTPPLLNSRCSGCRHAKYCSLECQKTDWKNSHKLICPALKQDISDGNRFRMPTLLLLKVLAKFARSPASVAPLLQLNSPRLALRQEKIRRERPGIADVLLHLLDFMPLTNEQKSAVSLELIEDMYARVEHFAIPITATHLDRIGQGIYLKASTIEHSCAPNACLTFDGKNVRVMALGSVDNVEQVRVSYLDALHPLEVRQKRLQTEFHVECRCVLCSDPAKNAERFCMPCINKKCDAKIPSDLRASLPCGKCGVKPTKNRLEEFRKVHADLDQLMASLPTDVGKVMFLIMQEKMSRAFHPSHPHWPPFLLKKSIALRVTKEPGWADGARKALEMYRAFLSPVDPRIGWCAFGAADPRSRDRADTVVKLEEASRVLNLMLGEANELAQQGAHLYKSRRDELNKT